MQRIDFYISNNNHHYDMMMSVMRELKGKGSYNIRLISLCEFRRMNTPIQALKVEGISYEILASLKVKGASTSTGRKGIGGNHSFIRNILRTILWNFKLKPGLRKIYKFPTTLNVLPNDSAFPYNKIVKWLRQRGMPHVVIQEGIRFPIPNEEGQEKYGSTSPRQLYAWGEQAAAYFKSIGVDDVIAAGNPRIDMIINTDYKQEIDHIRNTYTLGEQNVLYLSNPVDDQGFCSHEQKVDLFSKFLKAFRSLNNPSAKVLLKLHPREDHISFQEVIHSLGMLTEVIYINNASIFPLLKLADCAVVLASTAGLESLLLGTPIGVMKLPTHDYVFDYVSSGVAVPLDADKCEELPQKLDELLKIKKGEVDYSNYLQQHFSHLGHSATYISTALHKELTTL